MDEFVHLNGWPYEISRQGVVRRCDTHRVVSSSLSKAGYPQVTLWQPKVRNVGVHILLLEAFVSPRPEGQQARHLNDVPTDNRLENLAWGTPLENMADRERNGHTARGLTHGNSKITPEQHAIIQESPESLAVLAKRFGVSTATIAYHRRGRPDRHGE